jgi:hypothetical protein
MDAFFASVEQVDNPDLRSPLSLLVVPLKAGVWWLPALLGATDADQKLARLLGLTISNLCSKDEFEQGRNKPVQLELPFDEMLGVG